MAHPTPESLSIPIHLYFHFRGPNPSHPSHPLKPHRTQCWSLPIASASMWNVSLSASYQILISLSVLEMNVMDVCGNLIFVPTITTLYPSRSTSELSAYISGGNVSTIIPQWQVSSDYTHPSSSRPVFWSPSQDTISGTSLPLGNGIMSIAQNHQDLPLRTE